jgi:Acetyltransferase (GNAT) domain
MIVAAGDPKDTAKAVWDELFGPLRGEWDVFEYFDAPGDSPVRKSFEEFAGRDRRCLKTELVGYSICPYLVLPRTWNDYMRECSGSRRYTISYSMKKLSEQGQLEKRACENAGQLEGEMETFVSLHQESWVERGKPGSFSSDRFKRFHLRVAKDFLAKGMLFLRSFTLDGKPVASFYGFQYGGKLYYYLLGARVNPAKRVKTGTAVLGYCIEEAIAGGCREFDFLRGSEEYKYRWTSTERRNPRFRFYNRTGKALVFLVLGTTYRRTRGWLRTLPGWKERWAKSLARR